MEALLTRCETDLRAGLLATIRSHYEVDFAEVSKERAEGLAVIAAERANLVEERAQA
jgi:hypothetical protein